MSGSTPSQQLHNRRQFCAISATSLASLFIGGDSASTGATAFVPITRQDFDSLLKDIGKLGWNVLDQKWVGARVAVVCTDEHSRPDYAYNKLSPLKKVCPYELVGVEGVVRRHDDPANLKVIQQVIEIEYGKNSREARAAERFLFREPTIKASKRLARTENVTGLDVDTKALLLSNLYADLVASIDRQAGQQNARYGNAGFAPFYRFDDIPLDKQFSAKIDRMQAHLKRLDQSFPVVDLDPSRRKTTGGTILEGTTIADLDREFLEVHSWFDSLVEKRNEVSAKELVRVMTAKGFQRSAMVYGLAHVLPQSRWADREVKPIQHFLAKLGVSYIVVDNELTARDPNVGPAIPNYHSLFKPV